MKKLLSLCVVGMVALGMWTTTVTAGEQVKNGATVIVAKEAKVANSGGIQGIAKELKATQLNLNRTVLTIDANMAGEKVESLQALGHHVQSLKAIAPALAKFPEKAKIFAENSWKSANYTASHLPAYYTTEVTPILFGALSGAQDPQNPTKLQQKLLTASKQGGFNALADEVAKMISADMIAAQAQVVIIRKKMVEVEQQVAQVKQQR